jgi:hypothetical protein
MPASPAGFLFSDYSNEGIEHDNHGGRRMSASADDEVPPERIRVSSTVTTLSQSMVVT